MRASDHLARLFGEGASGAAEPTPLAGCTIAVAVVQVGTLGIGQFSQHGTDIEPIVIAINSRRFLKCDVFGRWGGRVASRKRGRLVTSRKGVNVQEIEVTPHNHNSVLLAILV